MTLPIAPPGRNRRSRRTGRFDLLFAVAGGGSRRKSIATVTTEEFNEPSAAGPTLAPRASPLCGPPTASGPWH